MSAPKTKLKACPICAGTDLMILPHRASMTEIKYEVTCKGCGAGAGPCDSVVAATVQWNTRDGAPPDATGDLANALGAAAVVFGMMHKIPDKRLLAEAERRGWVCYPPKLDENPT